jgi:hypothetical protein
VAIAIDVTVSIDLGRHYESCSGLGGENMRSRIDVKTGLDRRRDFLEVDERRDKR